MERVGILQTLKVCVKYIVIFLLVTGVLLLSLVFSANIPQSAIKEQVQESATYLCEGELFGRVVKDVDSSKIDRYADSILLGIAYQYDSEHPLASVMWSSYYHSDLDNENENLLVAVTNEYEANQQYLRYWHGSIAIVRPLLTFLNLKQIYRLNGVLLALLVIGLFVTLLRLKAYAPAVGIAFGLILTSFWFVPFSLEYTWTYLLMLIFSIIGVRLIYKKRYRAVGMFFLVSGMVTNFLDFLTTETLTLTVPLLLMLWMERKQNVESKSKSESDWKASFQMAGKAAITWGAGYVGMWLMKWLLASLVLSENVMPYVSEHIGERIGGDLGIGPLQYIFGTIWKNIKCLFPFEYGIVGAFTGIGLVVYSLYVGYVYYKKNIDKKSVLLYALIGLVPYIRYIVLHNHSYLHCFFTYRAQLATILAIVLILEQITDRRCRAHANGRKARA